jgi:predicted PurR-regulated permease PerM
MDKKFTAWQKYEQGFLIGLVLLSCFGLFTLFSSFILPLVFAVIIASATHPLYKVIDNKLQNPVLSSSAMITLLCFLVIFPVVYLLTVSGTTIFEIYQNNQAFFSGLNFDRLKELKDSMLSYLPLGDETISFISSQIDSNAKIMLEKVQAFAIKASKSLIDNSMSSITFIFISLFAMFFFFKDGRKIVEKIKIITPLHDDFDELLIQELYSLCGILTVSVFAVSVLQGVTFGFVTSFMDLNWLFIGIAISITSFIPVVGSLLVWIPLSVYLFIQGQTTNAVIIMFWGAVVNGFVIDNILRPWIIGKICELFNKNTKYDLSDFNPLDNTLLIILSTFGGVMLFGVTGLFLGPIIVALSLTMFDLYVLRVQSADEDNFQEFLEDRLNDKEK